MQRLTKGEDLSYRTIFLLWLPLAAMWLVMGVEMPLINGVIARLDEAKTNLAAFGITFSIALIIEAPIIQMLAAGAALADSKRNYTRLLNFMHYLGIGLTAFHILLTVTPAYSFLLREIMGIPDALVPLSRKSLLWLAPWAAAIGYRRLWQGILIRYKKTAVIPVTMAIRLIATAGSLYLGARVFNFEGAVTGAFALSCGVTAGALASYIFYLPVKPLITAAPEGSSLGWKELLRFYYPLALTSFFTFIVRPVINFGLAGALFPVESLAVWPVVLSLMFLLQSMAVAYQEVAVSLLSTSRTTRKFSRFAFYLGAVLTSGMLIIGFTPLADILYGRAGGLNEELLGFTGIPTIIMGLVPMLSAMLSWYRGLFIFRHRTGTIAAATLINSLVLIAVMMTVPALTALSGVIIAAFALTFSMLVETVFLKIRLPGGHELV